MTAGRRSRRTRGAVALAAAAVVLAGCSATTGSVDGSTRYVAGDGVHRAAGPGRARGRPGPRRHDAGRREARRRGPPRQGRRGEPVGVVVLPVPSRGGRAREHVHRDEGEEASSSSASSRAARTPSTTRARSPASSRCRTRRCSTATTRSSSRSTASCRRPRSRPRSSWTARAGWPRARLGEVDRLPAARDDRAGAGGVVVSVVDTVVSGSLLVAAPLAFTAGVVSFLSPCVLPLVPGYLSYVTGLSGAELAGEAGPRAERRGEQVAVEGDGHLLVEAAATAPAARTRVLVGIGALRARVHRRLRRLRCGIRRAGRVAVPLPGADHPCPRRGRRRPRSVVPRRHPRHAARVADAHPAPGGAVGGPAARRPVRPRLDPLHRPDARRRPDPGASPRRAPHAEPCCRRSTASASACPSSSWACSTAARSERSAGCAATASW